MNMTTSTCTTFHLFRRVGTEKEMVDRFAVGVHEREGPTIPCIRVNFVYVCDVHRSLAPALIQAYSWCVSFVRGERGEGRGMEQMGDKYTEAYRCLFVRLDIH